MSLVDKIHQILPQTQCRACGFDGCAPYADAVVNTGADIDLCRPGGMCVVEKISRLTGRMPTDKPAEIKARQTPQQKVIIDVDVCISELYQKMSASSVAAAIETGKSDEIAVYGASS